MQYKIILPYLATALITFLLTILLWPHKTVTVKIPASKEEVQEKAVEQFEAWKGSMGKVFETKQEYEEYIDSIKKSNTVTKRVPVEVEVPGKTKTVTVYKTVEVDCPCIPESKGQEFKALYSHSYNYPKGDTSKVRISLAYTQPDWLLHPDGKFKDLKVTIPEIKKTVEVPTPPRPFVLQLLSKGAYFAAGLGVGYLATR